MKVSTILLFLAFLGHHISSAATPFELTGKVIDAQTKEPLAGAIINIPELQISVNSDASGQFSLRKIPVRGNFLIEVRYIGYETITRMTNLNLTEPLSFELKPSVIEVHEVVITGTVSSASSRTNSTSVATVNRDELLSRGSANIIDAISHVAGVSQLTTGAGIAKPVIRGLSSNRVVTLSNGVKQEGQQWGDEHGIEIDQYSANRVEVLRGAASLLYGSDALGGVINIIDATPPAPGKIRGELLSNYATNNGLSANSIMLQGNTNGLVWQGRGTYKNAQAYQTPEGRIPNTGLEETNFGGMLGLNRSWGYTHLNLSSFNQKLGLPDFERNGEGMYEDEEGQILSPAQIRRRELMLPLQDVRHYKIALNSHILFNKGRMRSTFGFQNNQRRELEESFTEPNLFFDLQTYSYDLKYYFEESGGWQPVLGVAGSFQNSKNKAPELLIPDYDSQDFGAFAYLKKSWERTTMNAGLRFDRRSISGVQMEEDGEPKFSDFSNRFSNISGALGLTHDLTENLSLRGNVGSAFRAPNISELSSKGIHEGTFRFEEGNPGLDPERSFYADMALELHTQKLDMHFNVFNNYINDYIFPSRSNGAVMNVDGEDFDLYRYVQSNANLYGFEAGITFHPNALVHLENTFSLTRGRNLETDGNLPFMPAPNLRNEIRVEPKMRSKRLRDSHLSFEVENVFRQNKIDDEFESTTAGYSLFNATAGTTIQAGRQMLKVYLSGRNLFDKAYFNHLSRLKNEGILNQGRNITFGVVLPIGN